MALAAYTFTRDGDDVDFAGNEVPSLTFKASGCVARNVKVNGRSQVRYGVNGNQRTWIGNAYRDNEIIGGDVKNCTGKGVYAVGLKLTGVDISYCLDAVFAGDAFKDKYGKRVIALEWNGGRCSMLGRTETVPFDPNGHYDAFQSLGGELWAVRSVDFDIYNGNQWASAAVFIDSDLFPSGRGNVAGCRFNGGVIPLRLDASAYGFTPASVSVRGNTFQKCYSQPYLFKDSAGNPTMQMIANAATFRTDNNFAGVEVMKP